VTSLRRARGTKEPATSPSPSANKEQGKSVVPIPPKTVLARSWSMSDPVMTGAD